MDIIPSDDQIFGKLKRVVSEALVVEEDYITLKTHYRRDLGVDSVDFVTLLFALKEEFGSDVDITDEDAEKLTTIGESVKFIKDKMLEREKEIRIGKL